MTNRPYFPSTSARNRISCPSGGRNAHLVSVDGGIEDERRPVAADVEEFEAIDPIDGTDDRDRRPSGDHVAHTSFEIGADVIFVSSEPSSRATYRSTGNCELAEPVGTSRMNASRVPSRREAGPGSARSPRVRDEQPRRPTDRVSDEDVPVRDVRDQAIPGWAERRAGRAAAGNRCRPRWSPRETRRAPRGWRSAATAALITGTSACRVSMGSHLPGKVHDGRWRERTAQPGPRLDSRESARGRGPRGWPAAGDRSAASVVMRPALRGPAPGPVRVRPSRTCASRRARSAGGTWPCRWGCRGTPPPRAAASPGGSAARRRRGDRDRDA